MCTGTRPSCHVCPPFSGLSLLPAGHASGGRFISTSHRNEHSPLRAGGLRATGVLPSMAPAFCAHQQAREPASCQRGVDPPLRAAPTDCPGHGARSCPRRAHRSLPETERRGRGHFARVPGVPVAPPASAGERKAGAEGGDSAQAGRRAARRPLTHRPRASADLGGGVLGPHPRTPRGQGSQQHRVACARASDALTPALQPRRAPRRRPTRRGSAPRQSARDPQPEFRSANQSLTVFCH